MKRFLRHLADLMMTPYPTVILAVAWFMASSVCYALGQYGESFAFFIFFTYFVYCLIVLICLTAGFLIFNHLFKNRDQETA